MGETAVRILPPATGPNGMNRCFPHTLVEAYIGRGAQKFHPAPIRRICWELFAELPGPQKLDPAVFSSM
jgi:hypothetical protein